jgi:hypothetical protein
MVVSIIGIRQLHEVSMERALAAFILGVAGFCVLTGIFVLLFA